MKDCFFNIIDGNITNKITVKKCFEGLADGRYYLKIESKKKRTLKQSAYYWGCMVPLVKEGLRNAGYDEVKTNDDAHECIKALFLKRKIKSNVNDDEIEISGSTANLTTMQFGELIDEVIKWAAVYLNTQISYPNEALIMFCEHDPATSATIVDGGKVLYVENDLLTITK